MTYKVYEPPLHSINTRGKLWSAGGKWRVCICFNGKRWPRSSHQDDGMEAIISVEEDREAQLFSVNFALSYEKV